MPAVEPLRAQARLVLTALMLSGCCKVPYSARDRAPPVLRPALPGVVVVVNRERQLAGCTGTVVESTPAGTGFESLVLTARHCVVDDDGEAIASGIALPGTGDEIEGLRSPVYPATIGYASEEDETTNDDTIEWDENDWALLRVRSSMRLPVARLYEGDPASDLPAGTPVALLAFSDAEYRTAAGAWRLSPHEHRFRWRTISPEIVQGGHSGAPVVRDGEVVAIFTGYRTNSHGCWLATLGKRWLTKLTFVSMATIRARAAAQGFRFAAPTAAGATAR